MDIEKVLFFHILKNTVPCGFHGFWWEICFQWNPLSPPSLKISIVSLGAFKIFVVFSFQKFVVYICIDSFWFILFGVFLVSCQIWKIFNHYFFKYFFSSLFFLFFWDSNVRSFVVPQLRKALFIFLFFQFFVSVV